jgi:RyR domain
MSAPELPDLEVVSAKVHEAWMESKRAQGLTSRQSETGEELMVPYEQLSEPAKELDRAMVRAVYEAIRAAAAAE